MRRRLYEVDREDAKFEGVCAIALPNMKRCKIEAKKSIEKIVHSAWVRHDEKKKAREFAAHWEKRKWGKEDEAKRYRRKSCGFRRMHPNCRGPFRCPRCDTRPPRESRSRSCSDWAGRAGYEPATAFVSRRFRHCFESAAAEPEPYLLAVLIAFVSEPT